MITTKKYRAKSDEYGDLIKGSTDPGQIRKYQNSQDSFSSLADNEEWLADNFDKMIQVPDNVPAGVPVKAPTEVSDKEPANHSTLGAEEERVLRCLGASVIMRWNTIPVKLQRELFDTAGSSHRPVADSGTRRPGFDLQAQRQGPVPVRVSPAAAESWMSGPVPATVSRPS